MNLYDHIFDIDVISKALTSKKTTWINTKNGELLNELSPQQSEGSHLFKITPVSENLTPQQAYNTAIAWLDERDLIPPSMKTVCAGSIIKANNNG